MRSCAFDFAGLKGALHGCSERNGLKKVGEYVAFRLGLSNEAPASPVQSACNQSGKWLLLDLRDLACERPSLRLTNIHERSVAALP